jgi:hypothetical protein
VSETRSRFSSNHWSAPLNVLQQADGSDCVLQETLHIPHTSPDLLHPLRDKRSQESRTRDKQIRYPLVHLIQLATLRLLAVHNGRIGITFHASSASARRLISRQESLYRFGAKAV